MGTFIFIIAVIGIGLLGLALAVGALVVFPLTLGFAFLGWLLGGSGGALVGAGIAGVFGLIALACNS